MRSVGGSTAGTCAGHATVNGRLSLSRHPTPQHAVCGSDANTGAQSKYRLIPSVTLVSDAPKSPPRFGPCVKSAPIPTVSNRRGIACAPGRDKRRQAQTTGPSTCNISFARMSRRRLSSTLVRDRGAGSHRLATVYILYSVESPDRRRCVPASLF